MRWMWIDRIVELVPAKRAVSIKGVTLAEEQMHDHFAAVPGRSALPIFPATLIIEGIAQTAGILLGHASGFKEKVVLAKVSLAELDREVGPGQTLRYTVEIKQMDRAGAATSGLVEVMDHGASSNVFQPIGRVDLLCSQIDHNMAGMEFPSHNFVFSEAFQTLLRMSGVEVMPEQNA